MGCGLWVIGYGLWLWAAGYELWAIPKPLHFRVPDVVLQVLLPIGNSP
jgi:hypothetical protein